MSTEPDSRSQRELRRRHALVSIDRSREAMRRTLVDLRRPLQKVEQWKDSAIKLWPVLPSILLAGSLAWALLRALRRRPGAKHIAASRASAPPAKRGGFVSLLLEALAIYRLASQVRTLLPAIGSTRRQPMPTAARIPSPAVRPLETHQSKEIVR